MKFVRVFFNEKLKIKSLVYIFIFLVFYYLFLKYIFYFCRLLLRNKRYCGFIEILLLIKHYKTISLITEKILIYKLNKC